jgi:hypothetical protein
MAPGAKKLTEQQKARLKDPAFIIAAQAVKPFRKAKKRK